MTRIQKHIIGASVMALTAVLIAVGFFVALRLVVFEMPTFAQHMAPQSMDTSDATLVVETFAMMKTAGTMHLVTLDVLVRQIVGGVRGAWLLWAAAGAVVVLMLSTGAWYGWIIDRYHTIEKWVFALLGGVIGATVGASVIATMLVAAASSATNAAYGAIAQAAQTLSQPGTHSGTGVVRGATEIAEAIQSGAPFDLVEESELLGQPDALLARFMALQTQGFGTMLTHRITPQLIMHMPRAVLAAPIVTLFPDGTLSVPSFTREDVATLLPVIAPQFLFEEFGGLAPQMYGAQRGASFELLDDDLFDARQAEIVELQKQELRDFIAELSGYIAEADAALAHNAGVTQEIADAERELADAEEKYINEPQEQHDEFCSGQDNRPDACGKLKDLLADNREKVAEQRAYLEDLRAQVAAANADVTEAKRELIAGVQEIRDTFTDMEENPVPFEYYFGIFFPGADEISVKWFRDGENAPIDGETSFVFYLATAIHEYAHALANGAPDADWPRVFEEGMAEYVTTKAMAGRIASGDIEATITYIDALTVLEWLFESVSPQEFERLYFTDKSETALERTLAKAIPDEDKLEVVQQKIESLAFLPEEEDGVRAEIMRSVEVIVRAEDARRTGSAQ